MNENEYKLDIYVTKDNVTIKNKEKIHTGEYKITKCEFEFTEDYEGLTKKAIFEAEDVIKEMPIISNECDIPEEVLQDGYLQCNLRVYGYDIEEVEGQMTVKLRYSPTYDTFPIWKGSFIPNAEQGEEITPTQFEQYTAALNEGLEAIEDKIEEADATLEGIETAVTEANNLDLDVSKEGKVATVTLTKKDATTKVVTLSDGTSLMFNWDGTKLGIKTDEDAEYTYVDLQGVQGPIGPQGEAFQIKKTYSSVAEMNADFDNMQLGDYVMIASSVQVEDNAKLYTRGQEAWIFISDFSGAQGIKGETGATPNIQIGSVVSGNAPSVTRTGTNENPILNFVLEKGEKGDTGDTGATGETGNGIESIVKTGTSGLVDTYTITFTDGTTTTFEITNGEDGEVTQAQLDETNRMVEQAKLVYNALPKVNGSGEEITLNNTAETPLKLVLKGNTYQETTSISDGDEYDSPTPDFPQDIHVVTGNNTIKISDKNLFDINSNFHYNTNASGVTSVNNNYTSTDYIPCSAGEVYAISGIPNQTNDVYIKLVCFDENKNFISRLIATSGTLNTRYAGTATIPANGKYVMAQFHKTYITEPQLEKSSTATEYVEHQEQTYPINLGDIELAEIEDYDVIDKTTGKNLFDGANILNISVQANNLTTSSSSNARTLYIECKPNTTYTISKILSSRFVIGTSENQPIAGINTLLQGETHNAKTEATITTNANAHYLLVQYYLATADTLTEEVVKNTIQIELGLTATDYEPYGVDKWYKKSFVGKYVFDGTENWIVSPYGTNSWSLSGKISINYDTTKAQVFSTLFRAVSQDKRGSSGNNIIFSTTNNSFAIRNTNFASLEEVQSGTNGTPIYFPLATPKGELITDTTLIEQLNNLYYANAYKGQTNITQENSDLASIMNAETTRDLSDIFTNEG